MVHRQFDGAGLQHLGAKGRKFQHLLVGNLFETARLRRDARVGGVDAIDVRVDVAQGGLQRRGDGDSRWYPIRHGPASIRGHGRLHALEAGHDGDLLRKSERDEFAAVDVADARLAVRLAVVSVSCQPSQERALSPFAAARAPAAPRSPARPTPPRHRIRGYRAVGPASARPVDQLVRRARHRRNNHGDLMAGIDLALDVLCDIADAIEIGDGCAADSVTSRPMTDAAIPEKNEVKISRYPRRGAGRRVYIPMRCRASNRASAPLEAGVRGRQTRDGGGRSPGWGRRRKWWVTRVRRCKADPGAV